MTITEVPREVGSWCWDGCGCGMHNFTDIDSGQTCWVIGEMLNNGDEQWTVGRGYAGATIKKEIPSLKEALQVAQEDYARYVNGEGLKS